MKGNKYIIHIPSWYPSSRSTFNGIFIKNLISTLSTSDNENTHIVINWHNNTEAPLTNFILFIKGFFKSFKNPFFEKKDNIEYININYFHTNEYIFGSNLNRLENKIQKIVKKINQNFEIKLIHAHVSYPAGVIANNIATKFGLQYIITEHMSPFPFVHFDHKITENIYKSVQKSNFTIAVSNTQKTEIENKTKSKVYVIPNVVMTKEFANIPTVLKNDTFKFLSISIITKQKGLDNLIKAASFLKTMTSKKFLITIIGDGDLKEDLIKLAIKFNINDLIVWKGFMDRNNIVLELKNSNALVCSSKHESFGVTLVEALASGRPIVSTKCGGPEDIVNDSNGILVNVDSPNDLARGMLYVLQNSKKYNPELIYNMYLNKYSEKVIKEKYFEYYNLILNG